MRFSPLRLIIPALLLLTTSAFSQNSRSWVSGVGDDANPGTRTAPRLTYTGALAVTSTGGEIDAIDPGDFAPVTITQSVTIDGGRGLSSIMVSGSLGTIPAIVINAPGSVIEVTIRNLNLNGDAGNGTAGIQVLSPAIVHIENCNIFGFSGHGIDFEPTGGSALYIKNSYIYSCGGDGLFLKPAAASSISMIKSHVDDCAVGVHGDDFSTTIVQGSSAVGNTGAGFETTAGAAMTITNSLSSINGTGISSAGTVVIATTTVTNNLGEGLVNTRGAHIKSFHDNPVGENTSKKEGTATSSLPLR